MGSLKQRFTPLALEAGSSATRVSGGVTTLGGVGLLVFVTVGTLTGTPTFTPYLEALGANGSWATFWTASSAISAAGVSSYLFYPGASGGSYDEVLSLPGPDVWRVGLTYAGTPASDYADTTVEVVSL